jgi:PAS domain S-box-containing protein
MGVGSGDGARPPVLGGLVEAAPDAMVVIDAEGTIVLANGQASEMFGYDHDKLVGRSIDELVPASVHDAHRRHREAYLADPHVRPMGSGLDLQARRMDGSEFPVEISLAPMHAEDGLLISAAVRDVTRKRQEERLFRGLLEAAPDAMVIVDDGGCIVLVNARVEELFGYQRDELVGRSVDLLVPDRFAGMHVAFRSGYVAQPRPRPMGLAGDLFARRKDGSEFPVEISLAPLETDGGLLVSAAVRDISERRRSQEEADRVKDEFFATVSHELRTPLTSILGYSELMADLEDLSPQGRRFLQVITRSAERELRLVDDLLTLVAIEESGLSIRPHRIDLGAVVRDGVEAARPRADEVEIDLRMDVPVVPVLVEIDPDRVGQAIDNLLSNAIKFTPAGGEVRVSLRVRDGFAEVDVADSGDGVRDGDVERIFERLYRSGSAVAQQVPGAGLGLTIALAIAEAHQGSLTLVQGPVGGATFRIALPLVG